jgi:hypothetical protein
VGWIRIRIRNPHPDPYQGRKKCPSKNERSLQISCYELLDDLFRGLKASPVGLKSPSWIPTSKNIAFIHINIF